MIKVAIIGGSGYSGRELIGLLIRHPEVTISCIAGNQSKGQRIQDIYPRFSGLIDLEITGTDAAEIAAADCIFCALPHTVSMDIVKKYADTDKKIIDLSADFRLDDSAAYEKWYKKTHTAPELQKTFAYGLTELNKDAVAHTSRVANPGCYPTSIILGLAPMLTKNMVKAQGLIIDSKSGATGAGRKAALPLIYAEVNENFKPYKVDAHQHIPEIEQELGKLAKDIAQVLFVPHLLPVNQGILTTIYAPLVQPTTTTKVWEEYAAFYADKPFVRLKKEGEFPQVQDVATTNFCDIGVQVSADGKTLIIVSAIDNLMKGAAGQAVQNMNVMYGFEETLGLL